MIHLRASLGRMSTIEAGGALGQTTPWAVDNTHPVFFRVLTLLQVMAVTLTGQTVEFSKNTCSAAVPAALELAVARGSFRVSTFLITAAMGCCWW